MQWWTLRQLKSKDAETRRETVAKLAATDNDTVVEPLLAALENPDPEVRRIALKSLGKRREERAAQPMRAALRDPDFEVRTAACAALENLGDESVVPLITPLLRDENPAARWQAARALTTLRWRPNSDTEAALLMVAQGKYDKAAAYGPAAIEPLMLALKDAAFYKRMQAIEAMTRISDARVVKPLVSALRDADSHVRTAAVEALGELGEPAAVDPLLTALKDQDGNVRAAAVAALRKLGDPRCIDKLITLLRDDNWDVRGATVDALGRLKDPRTVMPLIGMLRDRDKDIRQSVISGLGRQGDERAITALVLMLKDQHVPVRDAALVALNRINKEWSKTDPARLAIPELQGALRDKEYWVRQAAEEALARLGIERNIEPEAGMGITDGNRQSRQIALEALARLLRDPDRDLRQAAAEALGRAGDAKCFDSLLASFQDEDEWVRRAAAATLGQLNWDPEDPTQRAQQIVILQEWDAAVELGAPAVEPLLAALKQRDSSVRQAVIESLGRIGDARAVPPLASALGDGNRAVRQTAAQALTLLRWQPEDEIQLAMLMVELGRWDKVGETGAAALEPLVATFQELATHPEALGPVASSLLRIVEGHCSSLTEDQLRAVAALEANIAADSGAWAETGPESTVVADCNFLRETARQELARRGLEV